MAATLLKNRDSRTMHPTPSAKPEDRRQSSPEGSDLITPIDLQRETLKQRGLYPAARTSQWINVLIIVAMVTVVMLVGTLLFLYFSRGGGQGASTDSPVAAPPHAQEPRTATEKPEAPTGAESPSGPPAPSPVVSDQGRDRAEEQLAAFTLLQNRLDAKAAAQWGGDDFAEMMDLGHQADQQMVARDFTTASRSYGAATALAQRLLDRADQVLETLLKEGEAALAAGDAALARARFTVALGMAPGDTTAQKGLQRAADLKAVDALLAKGKGHEAAGQPALAYADYQQALELDPLSREGKAGLERAARRLKTDQFNQLMAAGLRALDQTDFQTARTHLEKAHALDPRSPSVADALARLDQAQRVAHINRLRQPARSAENKEDWPAALAYYQKILKLDPHIQFALEGQARAREQIRIAGRLSYFLNQPQVLASDTHLQQALALLDEVRDLSAYGPGLAGQVQRVKELVRAYQTPIEVTLTSDSLTDVAVYRVGKLGSFSAHSMALRPGTYTIVGSRNGYRDVRREITLAPGQTPLTLAIICRDEI